MNINMKKTVQVDAKVFKMCAKCSDCCGGDLIDKDGMVLKQHDGYVPGFFPGGGGDYVELDIDIDTGQILNWRKPSAEQIEEFIGDGD